MILTIGRKRIKNFLFYSGFSLLELLVVLGVISSTVTLGYISFHSHLSETLLKASVRELVSTLRWARSLAITKREIHKVVFQSKRRRYWIEDKEGNCVEGLNYLKEGVVFANPEIWKSGVEEGIIESGISDGALSFYPQGTAEGGSIYLKDKRNEKWYTLTVNPLTGSIKVYEGKH